VAGSAGDRPVGIAVGAAGHGDSAAYVPRDRASDPSAPLSSEGRALHDRVVVAVDDDLDMPVALALLREILRARLPADERRWLVLDADLMFGLDLHRVWDAGPGAALAEVPEAIWKLLAERTAARRARDFARSDAVRDELAGLGWDVVDSVGGSTVRRRP
jgi:cysteinyl-tRNA synthetase